MSGYTPCACRDCMDVTVSADMSKRELCTDCQEAGCTVHDGPEPTYGHPGVECQRTDAYGDNTALNAAESVRKDITDATLAVGDTVFCNGVYAAVERVTLHAPWTHKDSPIRNDWTAEEIITAEGSRWHGHAPDGPVGDVTD